MQDTCWNQIGVRGDRSCPKLQDVIHCQNCPVYGQSGRGLLERSAPDGYIAEWTELLAQPRQQQDTEQTNAVSVTIFRLGSEWMALPADIFSQVLSPNPVHTLPHYSARILRGIVNVRGQLLLCVSLHELLGVTEQAPTSAITATPSSTHKTSRGYSRLVVIEQQSHIWAFEVDELYGLQRCLPKEFSNSPTLASQTLESFTQNILHWREKSVSYLDSDHLFEALQQQAL
ncbi:MAG: chemotaxis protein CheW [Cyanobacteria bacterium P01_F01_bin.86]